MGAYGYWPYVIAAGLGILMSLLVWRRLYKGFVIEKLSGSRKVPETDEALMRLALGCATSIAAQVGLVAGLAGFIVAFNAYGTLDRSLPLIFALGGAAFVAIFLVFYTSYLSSFRRQRAHSRTGT